MVAVIGVASPTKKTKKAAEDKPTAATADESEPKEKDKEKRTLAAAKAASGGMVGLGMAAAAMAAQKKKPGAASGTTDAAAKSDKSGTGKTAPAAGTRPAAGSNAKPATPKPINATKNDSDQAIAPPEEDEPMPPTEDYPMPPPGPCAAQQYAISSRLSLFRAWIGGCVKTCDLLLTVVGEQNSLCVCDRAHGRRHAGGAARE